NLGFEASIGATGWQILPGGLIFQWGTVIGDRGNLGAAYPIAFKERVFQVLLTLNDKTAGEVDGISLYATRDNFTNKTTLIVQNKGKDLLGVTTASYFAIGK
ncbi:gp53-like domain-containing protein, partial [Morganella morganii]|uniref:gp53-like domain-containing protein n=1 Tax=Morganella morganii TaxID=582 RepID=UPI00066742A8